MRRQEEKEMQECTFKPKLYWGSKLRRKRGASAAPPSENKPPDRSVPVRGGHRSLSPRRRLFEPLKPLRKALPPPMKPIPILPPPPRDPVPTISMSPMLGIEDASSCGSLSLLRRHHDMMWERNQRASSPNPPLPLEIITTNRSLTRPWQTTLYSARDGSISPLRERMLGIEIDEEIGNTPMAPRIIFCGTTVAGESVAAQTQATEYGSI
jgi:hypothetical protein